ncbi:TPA: metallophosphoesterase [Pseudomonas aeruginosa]|nr:metallophosphoesterase [Pseudomonas aeruginosa]
MTAHRFHVARLPLNRHGRVFAIGDVHGAFDLVWEGMKMVRFDPQVDMIISVGDLIDRGTGSHRVPKFLRQPYVRAVCGNHEAMLIDLYSKGEPPHEILQFAARHNGFAWWLGTDRATRQAVLDAIRKLPLVIELETTRGNVGVVHAEVPIGMSWQAFVARVEAGDKQTIHSALWGDARIKQRDQSGVQGIGRVFVGHRIQWQGLQRLGNVYALDTGATFAEIAPEDARGARLTFANMAMATVKLDKPPISSARVDSRDGTVPLTPFGDYVRN